MISMWNVVIMPPVLPLSMPYYAPTRRDPNAFSRADLIRIEPRETRGRIHAAFFTHTLLSWKAAPPWGATGSAPVSTLMPRPPI